MTELHKVFTYGILQGGGLPATIRGDLYDMGPFPAAVRIGMDLAGTIHGQLIEVDDATLADFDRIEGHPTFYERITTTVTMADGSEVEAYVYSFVNRGNVLANKPLLISGQWDRTQILPLGYKKGDSNG